MSTGILATGAVGGPFIDKETGSTNIFLGRGGDETSRRRVGQSVPLDGKSTLKFVNSVASVVCEKCCFAFGLLDVKLPSSCTASAHTGQCGKAW